MPTAFFRQCPTSQLAPQVLAIQLEEVEGIIEEDMLARRLAPQLLEHRKPVLIAGDRLAIDQAGTHLEPVNGFDDERYPLHERSGWRCEGLALLHDVSAQNSDLDVAGFPARMGGFGRNVECIANLDHASRLPLDGKLESAFQDIGGFDSGMRVPRHGHARLDGRFREDRGVAWRRTVHLRQDLSRDPGVVATGAPWAEASAAMNSVIPQIAHDAKPANPRRVNMTVLPAFVWIISAQTS